MPAIILDNVQELKKFTGQEFAASGWIEVTQERINQFAAATGDHQWIHIDRERAAKESPFGTTIAHGFLTLSLLSMLMKEALEIRGGIRMGINYGLNRVRFPSPVPSGARLRARFTLQSLTEVAGGLEAVYSVTVEAEGGKKPCCVAEWVVRYYV